MQLWFGPSSFERCLYSTSEHREDLEMKVSAMTSGSNERQIIRIGYLVATFQAQRIAEIHNMKRRKLGRQLGLHDCGIRRCDGDNYINPAGHVRVLHVLQSTTRCLWSEDGTLRITEHHQFWLLAHPFCVWSTRKSSQTSSFFSTPCNMIRDHVLNKDDCLGLSREG